MISYVKTHYKFGLDKASVSMASVPYQSYKYDKQWCLINVKNSHDLVVGADPSCVSTSPGTRRLPGIGNGVYLFNVTSSSLHLASFSELGSKAWNTEAERPTQNHTNACLAWNSGWFSAFWVLDKCAEELKAPRVQANPSDSSNTFWIHSFISFKERKMWFLTTSVWLLSISIMKTLIIDAEDCRMIHMSCCQTGCSGEYCQIASGGYRVTVWLMHLGCFRATSTKLVSA